MDVVTLGESMVTFLPGRPGRLADVPSFDRAIGGAESNVACALAAFGHTARWVSRVGADGFGDHLVERIAGYGVDVSAVRRDPDRPTGVYFRTAGDRGTGAHEVAYYRAGSAASAMSTRNVDLAAVRAARVLHLSGITAALSDTCLDLLRALTAPGPDRPLISFDVNHRPGLWRTAEGPRVLLEVARHADVVFVGEDEAEQAWGVTGGPEAIRGVLPEPGVVVVKQGERGATAFAGPGRSAGADRDRATASRPSAPPPSGPPLTAASPAAHPLTAAPPTETSSAAPPPPETSPSALPPSAPPLTAAPHAFEPALRTAVVATTGAGDAFAAGFLSATLRGLPLRTRLRHGHLFAAAALTAPGDLAPPPARDHADRLAALDAGAWGRLRLGPGWTQADRATEEANNP
ncbi:MULTISPECIES: sugar kinase [Streptomyces]|uniref:sugar kinase n=1 Tax=Streptomyces TaxID=1883 RepID=UPI00073DE7A3|nr:sugar kinase [Streptomyces sp. EAS-AB2608]MYU29724.1 sugar kinase [Streptomyces sp. SID7810]BCM69162.1 putative 2-oxo-3-deoxygluconate kinase [Streptomyces sp. EAS-AB2608]CUW30784.1 2-dehydro-3-deoxygluconokinase [Streptomyces reticuli]